MSSPSRLTQDAQFILSFPISGIADDLPNWISAATSLRDFSALSFDWLFCSIYVTFRPAPRALLSYIVLTLSFVYGFWFDCQIFLVSLLKSVVWIFSVSRFFKIKIQNCSVICSRMRVAKDLFLLLLFWHQIFTCFSKIKRQPNFHLYTGIIPFFPDKGYLSGLSRRSCFLQALRLPVHWYHPFCL